MAVHDNMQGDRHMRRMLVSSKKVIMIMGTQVGFRVVPQGHAVLLSVRPWGASVARVISG